MSRKGYSSTILLGSLLLLSLSCISQPTARIDSVIERAAEFYDNNRTDSMLVTAQFGLDLLNNSGDDASATEYRIARAHLHSLAGTALRMRLKRDKAFGHFMQALDIYRSLDAGDTPYEALANWGVGKQHKDPQTRRAFLKRALDHMISVKDSASVIGICLDAAIHNYREGNLEQMRDLLSLATEWFGPHISEQTIGRIYFQFGRYYEAIGDVESALFYHNKAYDVIWQSSPNDPVLFNIARDLSISLDKKGQSDQGISVLAELLTPDSPDKSAHRYYAESNLFFEMGRISMNRGDLELAESYLSNCVSNLRRADYSRYHLYSANPIAALAQVSLTRGDTVQSMSLLARIDSIISSHELVRHPDYARINLTAATVHQALGQVDLGLNRVRDGFRGLGYSDSTPSDFSEVYRYDLLAQLIMRRTLLLQEAVRNNSPGPYETILDSHLSLHLLFLDSLQQFRLNPSVLSDILETHYPVFEIAMQRTVSKFEETRDAKHLQKAFMIAERSRDQIMRRFRLNNRLRRHIDTPDSLRNKEAEILQQLADIEVRQYSGKGDSLNLRQEWRALTVELNGLTRLINARPVDQGSLTFDRLIEVIPDQTTVMEIFSGAELDYFFFLREGDLDIITIEADKVYPALAALRESLINPESDWKPAARAVAKPIIEVLMASSGGTDQLMIIPDGPWAGIPFEVLMMNNEVLLTNYAVSYANSLHTWQLGPQSSDPDIVLGAFAPEYSSLAVAESDTADSEVFATLVRSGNYALPGAQKEVERIQQLMGGDAFYSSEASEEAFRQYAPGYDILHLSMHALLEQRNPNLSRLVFTNTGSANHDDFLFASELLTMQLRARLAVLSACNTGSGSIVKGEGVMSLSRAFQYAGVGSVVHSLWKVPDAATADLMVHFYQAVEDGQSKADALRTAKLTYLESVIAPEQAHPFYWAGFVINGNTDALREDGPLPELAFQIFIYSIILSVLFIWVVVEYLEF